MGSATPSSEKMGNDTPYANKKWVPCSDNNTVLPARRSNRGICYGDVAEWLTVWVSVRHTPILYQNG